MTSHFLPVKFHSSDIFLRFRLRDIPRRINYLQSTNRILAQARPGEASRRLPAKQGRGSIALNDISGFPEQFNQYSLEGSPSYPPTIIFQIRPDPPTRIGGWYAGDPLPLQARGTPPYQNRVAPMRGNHAGNLRSRAHVLMCNTCAIPFLRRGVPG